MNVGQGSDLMNHLKVQLLVRAYQTRGHHKAKIDPLNIPRNAEAFGYSRPTRAGTVALQLLRTGHEPRSSLSARASCPRFKSETREKMTLREIIEACENIYCGSYGVEYIHIPDQRAMRLAARALGDSEPVQVLAGRKASHPRPADLGHQLRVFPGDKVPERQTVWPGRRRDPHSGNEGLDRPKRRLWLQRDRHRHAPPRPPQRLEQRRPKAKRVHLQRVCRNRRSRR